MRYEGYPASHYINSEILGMFYEHIEEQKLNVREVPGPEELNSQKNTHNLH